MTASAIAMCCATSAEDIGDSLGGAPGAAGYASSTAVSVSSGVSSSTIFHQTLQVPQINVPIFEETNTGGPWTPHQEDRARSALAG